MIFLSFRHEDTLGVTRLLWTELGARFGRDNVYYYFEQPGRAGGDVYEKLDAEIAKAQVVLALFGPRWIEARDELGRRRIDDPDDLVRYELTQAAAYTKTVIAIRIEGARIPRAEHLPGELGYLSRLDLTLPYSEEERDADLARIIRSIELEVGLPSLEDASVSAPVHAAAPWRGPTARINASSTRLPFAPEERFELDAHATTPVATGLKAISPRNINVVHVLLSNERLAVIHLGSIVDQDQVAAFNAGERDSDVWILPYTMIRDVSLERFGSDSPKIEITYEWAPNKRADLVLSSISPKDRATKIAHLLKAKLSARDPLWRRLL